MITDDGKQKEELIPLVQTFKEQLYAHACIGPARLELERRRLLAIIRVYKEAEKEIERANPGLWRWPFAIAAAVLLAIAGAVMWPATPAPKPLPPVMLAGMWRLSKGDTFFSGRPIRVPDDRGAKIVWPNQTAIWLAANAEVSLHPSDTVFVQLRRGRLLASVTPTEKSKSFRITTPLGNVVVHGTAFSISGDNDRITVRLHEGSVTFEYTGNTVTLAPGFELDIQKDTAPRIRRMDDTGVLADLMIAEKTANLEGPPLPTLGRRIEMSPIKGDTSKQPTKKRVKTNRPTPRPPVASIPSYKEDDLFIDPILEAIEVESADAVDDADPTALIESMIQKGHYLSGLRTAEAYLDAHPKGAHVERVQFLKGYCQTRSGNLKAGRRAFETYLVQFPEGCYWKRVSDILGE